MVGARGINPFFPFCSQRCRLIDLGKWLGEEYRVPTRAEENEDEQPIFPESSGDGKPP